MSEIATSNPVYFDSSIWIAYAIGAKDRNFLFAKDLIERMDNGKFQVYVSNLVLMEVVHVIRMKTVQYEKYSGRLNAGKSANLKNTTNQKIKDFLNSLTSWESEKKVIFADPDIQLDDFLQNSFLHLQNYWGELRNVYKCRICRRPLRSPQYSYKGLGQWDFQHAMIAHSLNSSVLYSTDRDFRHLTITHQFDPLVFSS